MSAALEIRNITKSFGGLQALSDVSCTVPSGTIYGVIGPNGAGKTTLFNCMSGALRPDAGEILVGSLSVRGLQPHDICRHGLVRTFQIVRPFRSMTVLENVKVAAFSRHVDAGGAERAAIAALTKLNMASFSDRPASTLGLAALRRLEMARAIATEPQVLLLDEMLAGLTAVETAELSDQVRALNADGLTIVIVEHSIPVIRSLCARAVVLDFGRVLMEGEINDVLEDRRVQDAYLGSQPA